MARAEVISDMKMVLDDVFSSRNAYLNVLDTISKFHKYSYEQQLSLSLYAGSDYSAVADERVWTQVFHVNINPDVKSLFDFQYEDFELVGYDPHPHIKAEVSV